MTSPLYTEESSSETAMEGSLEVFWAETIEPENTPIEIKLSKNRKINLFSLFRYYTTSFMVVEIVFYMRNGLISIIIIFNICVV